MSNIKIRTTIKKYTYKITDTMIENIFKDLKIFKRNLHVSRKKNKNIIDFYHYLKNIANYYFYFIFLERTNNNKIMHKLNQINVMIENWYKSDPKNENVKKINIILNNFIEKPIMIDLEKYSKIGMKILNKNVINKSNKKVYYVQSGGTEDDRKLKELKELIETSGKNNKFVSEKMLH